MQAKREITVTYYFLASDVLSAAWVI